MGWDVTIETSPSKVGEALRALEDLPARKVERDQLEAAIAAVPDLVRHVSARERVRVQLIGHSDPDADGFDGRHLTISISRMDPEAIERADAEAKASAEAAAAQAEAEEIVETADGRLAAANLDVEPPPAEPAPDDAPVDVVDDAAAATADVDE